MKMPIAVLVVACSCLLPMSAQAAWSREKTEQVTDYLRQYRKDWTSANTDDFLTGKGQTVNMGGAAQDGGTTTLTIRTDDGRAISLVATGQSLLVDGKDVTGNLGNKTTYGANSPIIENIKDSQVAAGAQNSVARDTTTNYSLTISLSLALSVSVVLNLYLLRKTQLRGRSRGVKAVQPKKSAVNDVTTVRDED